MPYFFRHFGAAHLSPLRSVYYATMLGGGSRGSACFVGLVPITFAHVSAMVGLTGEDYYSQKKRLVASAA
jgi:hypothetical protein